MTTPRRSPAPRARKGAPQKGAARKRWGLSLDPQFISDAGRGGEAWYYEEPAGLGIYVAAQKGMAGLRIAFIPWRAIMASAARKSSAPATGDRT